MRFPLARWVTDASFGPLDGGHGVAETEDDTEVAEMVLQRLDYLSVAELEHARPLLDDRDLRAERREHRGVLDPDHTCADDDEGAGDSLQAQQAVRVDDRQPVEVDRHGMSRLGAYGNDDVRGADAPRSAAVAVHGQDVLVDESRRSLQQLDMVSLQLVADDVDLASDDAVRPLAEVLHRDVGLDPVALAVHLPLAHAGQVDDCFSERLGRDRSGVHAHAADHGAALDHGHCSSELRRLDSRALTGRAGPDHDEVDVVAHPESLPVFPVNVG